jgi:hypothetical protein
MVSYLWRITPHERKFFQNEYRIQKTLSNPWVWEDTRGIHTQMKSKIDQIWDIHTVIDISMMGLE